MSHYDPRSYDPRSSVGYLLRQGAALLRDEVEDAFAGRECTFIQWVTLLLVRENLARTPGDLCRDLRHDSGALTRLLDQLEQRGLIRRERSAEDRRAVLLRITPPGRRVVSSLLPLVTDHLNHALADFTATEVATFTRLLQRLIATLAGADRARPSGRERATRR